VSTHPVPAQPARPQNTDQPTPEVGQRYTHRPGYGDRTVTVTRVWNLGDGYGTAVAFEWGSDDDLCGSACPVGAFHRVYELAAEQQPAPGVTVLESPDPAPGAEQARADGTLRQRIETALREHGMVHLGADAPADEYECCATALLPLFAAERETGHINGLGEGADIAETLPTPDNCRDMGSYDDAWDAGAYAVAAALRARANELDHAAGGEQTPSPQTIRQLVDQVAAELHDGDPTAFHGGDGTPGDCKRCAQTEAGGEQA
jgi:hypothetical protein